MVMSASGRKLQSVLAGSKGRSAAPMQDDERRSIYLNQNGNRPLTSAQLRRIRKGANRASNAQAAQQAAATKVSEWKSHRDEPVRELIDAIVQSKPSLDELTVEEAGRITGLPDAQHDYMLPSPVDKSALTRCRSRVRDAAKRRGVTISTAVITDIKGIEYLRIST